MSIFTQRVHAYAPIKPRQKLLLDSILVDIQKCHWDPLGMSWPLQVHTISRKWCAMMCILPFFVWWVLESAWRTFPRAHSFRPGQRHCFWSATLEACRWKSWGMNLMDKLGHWQSLTFKPGFHGSGYIWLEKYRENDQCTSADPSETGLVVISLCVICFEKVGIWHDLTSSTQLPESRCSRCYDHIIIFLGSWLTDFRAKYGAFLQVLPRNPRTTPNYPLTHWLRAPRAKGQTAVDCNAGSEMEPLKPTEQWQIPYV